MTDRIAVRNPRTGAADYAFDNTGPETLDRHVASMRAAQKRWAARPLSERIEILRRWSQAYDTAAAGIHAALVVDTGRLSETNSEIGMIRNLIERWCNTAPAQLESFDERPTSMPWIQLQGQLVPYALVGVISPWNFPLVLSLIDAVPALLAGSAVLVKPSEVTPRFVEPLQRSVEQVPELAEVFRFVQGDGSTGAAMLERIDMVVFTGSVATGRKVGAEAARNFIPAFLELGGKDPALVLQGADLDRATSALAWGSTANAGQACQSIERIYVHEAAYDAFVELLVEKINRLKLAVPTPADGQIGPVIFARQAEILQAHLDDAFAKGATARTGGKLQVIDGGTYLFPTVLTGVTHDMLVMTEETFGPILPVMKFHDTEQGIEFANHGIYGLSAAVFAATESEAITVAQRLDAGGISINDSTLTAIVHEGEKMSFGMSGLGGSRMGPTSIRRFLRQKLLIKSRGTAGNPWWYEAVR